MRKFFPQDLANERSYGSSPAQRRYHPSQGFADSQVARLGDRAAELMGQEGVTSEEVPEVLAEERARYFKEHYRP